MAVLLLSSHLYLMVQNTTTWEFILAYCNNYLCQYPRNMFDHGLAQYLTHFCWWLSMSWKSLWVQDQEEASSKTA